MTKMKYDNKTQAARQKYLQALPLSPQEQAQIKKDLLGEDFCFFQSDDTTFILPEKYSAETTYRLIEERIKPDVQIKRRAVIKYISYAAAIVVIALLSTFGIHYYNTQQSATLFVSTSYGEKKEVVLPDGSTVMLNSLSSIAYPKKMNGKTREVALQGEGYFDVAKNPDKTFIVKVDDIEVRVLGTKFNVNAYEDRESITTTLFEGIVSVGINNEQARKLQPGEQAVFARNAKELEIHQLKDIVTEEAWRNNILVFDNEALADILNTLSREYKVAFNIDNDELKQLRITGRFSSAESIDDVLTVLGESAGFGFAKRGNMYELRVKN